MRKVLKLLKLFSCIFLFLNSISVNFFVSLIIFYKRRISPCFAVSCRFYPSCSSYAIKALRKFNVFKALILIVGRLLRCNWKFKGGIDDL